jgi:CO/xanthine dehydrogenase FAD-binding subunit
MRSRFEYLRPKSLSEALKILGQHGQGATVLAGGTDVMIDVREGEFAGKFLVDVSRLEELRKVEMRDGLLFIGAALTFTEITENPLVLESAPALAKAVSCVGSLQIRNVGTVGGNVGNASPAADSVPALVAHMARVQLQSASSKRTPLVEEFIVAPYRTDLKAGELITGFALEPMKLGYQWSAQRIARRGALAIARATAAALGKIGADGAVEDLRLSVGSITPQPARMTAAEELVCGSVPNPQLIQDAARKVSEEMVRRSGIRPTTEYKRPAVEGLVIKVLTETLLKNGASN